MAGNRQPIVVLVSPQLGENIGMCARAMLNCGLERLRLVSPRDGWPSAAARAAAADADRVIDGAEVFPSLDAALADCHRVLATSSRRRTLAAPVWDLEDAAARLAAPAPPHERVAVLFGPEASGLDNEAAARAEALLRFPTEPSFPVLNLAQSVLLFGWEWRRASLRLSVEGSEPPAAPPAPAPAPRRELDGFLARLESELDARGFFPTPEMRPGALRTLRSLLSRARPAPRELALLHGALTALARPPRENTGPAPPSERSGGE